MLFRYNPVANECFKLVELLRPNPNTLKLLRLGNYSEELEVSLIIELLAHRYDIVSNTDSQRVTEMLHSLALDVEMGSDSTQLSGSNRQILSVVPDQLELVQLSDYCLYLLTHELLEIELLLGLVLDVATHSATVGEWVSESSDSVEGVVHPFEGFVLVGYCSRTYLGVEGLFYVVEELGFDWYCTGQCSDVAVYLLKIGH